MEDLDQRLEAATKRRDTLAAECQRIEGRLDSARAALSAVEAECRAKGVDPEKIDATIEQLESKYRTLVEQLERDVAAASEALAPFSKETDR